MSYGISFKTRGDTEVLLAAYRQWGVDCLKHLNGMFAFAIWDKRMGLVRETILLLEIVLEKSHFTIDISKINL